MRISDHMGLSNDNKVTPENARALGHEPFMGWYEDTYRRHRGQMTDEQWALAEKIYGPANEEFVATDPRGDDLTRWNEYSCKEPLAMNGALVHIDYRI